MMNENNTQNGYKIAAGGGLLLLLIGLLVGISYLAPAKEKVAETAPEISLPNAFDDISLMADAAVVFDIKNNEVLYGVAEETPLPLASVTKLLSVYTAVSTLGENGYIRITPEDLSPEGDSALLVSETWKVGDLARFTLISSSNDGAYALTRAVSERENKTPATLLSQAAVSLSLPQTYALNGTGLDANQYTGGAYGSAIDVAHLLKVLYDEHRDLLIDASKEQGTYTSAEGFTHIASSTNELAGKIVGLVGAKTGYTDLAGGNLAVLIEVAPQRPIAIVVLGSTKEGRFADVRNLAEKTLQHFTYTPTF
ncbi:MAG: D-alanyl-D-alanine carboxypeptidase family protein [Patescibacteria group bacterium UBA2103]